MRHIVYTEDKNVFFYSLLASIDPSPTFYSCQGCRISYSNKVACLLTVNASTACIIICFSEAWQSLSFLPENKITSL